MSHSLNSTGLGKLYQHNADDKPHQHNENGAVIFCKHYAIGPFQFLALTLIVSEILLGAWMLEINPGDENAYFERIVVGSFSITILVAVLVIFCIVYNIKKTHHEFDSWHKKPDS